MSVTRFLLRLPSTLHRRLTARAGASELSLNEYCVRMLSGPEPLAVAQPAAVEVLRQAEAVAGAKLLGVLVHGSWARGEARTASDLDLLIAVDATLALSRGLYRAWDRAPATWEGRAVDAHFVHLPREPQRAGSVWCEAALDGIVLFDRDRRIEQTLGGIRRAIADGRLIRKYAHGQPYWTMAA